MPLQNRVTPFGDIVAHEVRGMFMGNRGGRIHDPETRTLARRRWGSRQWICCVTRFKGRHRPVMGRGYTELFFLDEVTALAAGHRPCFECRRADARAFAAAWAEGQGLSTPPSAPEMDAALHAERLAGREKRLHRVGISGLPDGTMIALDGVAHALCGDALLPWSFKGYGRPVPRPAGGAVFVLTPPSILAALMARYRPQWHGSAG